MGCDCVATWKPVHAPKTQSARGLGVECRWDKRVREGGGLLLTQGNDTPQNLTLCSCVPRAVNPKTGPGQGVGGKHKSIRVTSGRLVPLKICPGFQVCRSHAPQSRACICVGMELGTPPHMPQKMLQRWSPHFSSVRFPGPHASLRMRNAFLPFPSLRAGLGALGATIHLLFTVPWVMETLRLREVKTFVQFLHSK